MTDKVVGLSYDMQEETVPTVILKAAGAQAQAVLDRARQAGDVTVVKDPQLVRELYRVPMDNPIGRELFPVMAALLAHIIQVDQEQQRQAGERT
jgi:type III secretion system FlhB-like substrate exporter